MYFNKIMINSSTIIYENNDYNLALYENIKRLSMGRSPTDLTEKNHVWARQIHKNRRKIKKQKFKKFELGNQVFRIETYSL